jgi:hypothetical protein
MKVTPMLNRNKINQQCVPPAMPQCKDCQTQTNIHDHHLPAVPDDWFLIASIDLHMAGPRYNQLCYSNAPERETNLIH